MPRLLTAALVAALLLPLVVDASAAERQRTVIVRTIVLDPGHGGEDHGAAGDGGLKEKEVTLAIARKLKSLIEADPELRRDRVRVVLTRNDDRKLSLEDRAARANREEGDLYISVHTNSHPVKSAYGAETFILSLKASDEHARMVAEAENEAFEGENGSLAENDDLKLILFDVIQKKYIEESKFLAEKIQTEFNTSLNLGDRGVKQAPFRVLKGVSMPAVLVEVDFISNPRQEQLLRTDAYRTRIAQSLMRAIKNYKQIKERGYATTSSGGSQQRHSP
jgi:N-acetylmuramoyl-L-alanine amidase